MEKLVHNKIYRFHSVNCCYSQIIDDKKYCSQHSGYTVEVYHFKNIAQK